jgi:hypothetical protein
MKRLVTIGILLVMVQTAKAEDERSACPGLTENSSADQQALCWFRRSTDDPGACAAAKKGVNPCISQAAAWCGNATFDDPSVASACFLAHLRAGQFAEAQTLQRYLSSPEAQVDKCMKALDSIKVRFTTVPAGAEILIDGREYGRAPVDAELRAPWWKSKVIASFGIGQGATDVKVSSNDFIASFNRQTCDMAEVTIRAPETASSTKASSSESPPATDLPLEEPPAKGGGVSPTAIIALAVGAAGVITGGILLGIAGSRASYLRSRDNDTQWSSKLADYDQSLKPLSIGGGVALGLGAALTAVGIVMVTTGWGSSSPEGADDAVVSLRLNGPSIQCEGTF